MNDTYQCPWCGSNHISVLVSVWRLVVPEGTDDDPEDGAEEWTDDSGAKCNWCHWSGYVRHLKRVENSAEDDE